MTIDQILNGTLEAECRAAFAKLSAACPPGYYPEIAIRIGPGDNGWIGCMIAGNGTHKNIGYAYTYPIDRCADQAIAMATAPEQLEKLRTELQQELRKIQAQLEVFPAPTPAPEANTEPVEA